MKVNKGCFLKMSKNAFGYTALLFFKGELNSTHALNCFESWEAREKAQQVFKDAVAGK